MRSSCSRRFCFPTSPSSCRRILALLCAATTLAPASLGLGAPAVPQTTIYIAPLGRALPEADVQLVVHALRGFYGLPVKLLARQELPRSAWYTPRKRYRAEKLLRFLDDRRPADAHRVLGLTAEDISTTNGPHPDWGILGLATIDGRTAVISAYRCARKARSALHARQRLAKVAVHELGHTLGLDHCPVRGCLMEDARGKVTTTDREYDLCATCRKRLAARGRALNARPVIPWPRPR